MTRFAYSLAVSIVVIAAIIYAIAGGQLITRSFGAVRPVNPKESEQQEDKPVCMEYVIRQRFNIDRFGKFVRKSMVATWEPCE